MSANLHGPEFPDGLFYAPDYNLWLREEVDGSPTLGLNAYGRALYGEIFAFIPEHDGWYIERDRSFGMVESVKAVSSARSPLAGTLLANNPVVVKRPALVNRDCYGEGWMVRLQLDDWTSVRGAFFQENAAQEVFTERMRLNGFDPQHPGMQALDFWDPRVSLAPYSQRADNVAGVIRLTPIPHHR